MGVLAQIKADKDSVDALVQPVETADRLYQEIQTWQIQIDELEYKLDFRGQGVKSMEEIQSELSILQGTRYIILTYHNYFIFILLLCNLHACLSLNYIFNLFLFLILVELVFISQIHAAYLLRRMLFDFPIIYFLYFICLGN